eukprot:6859505-Prymnesium_polylepis.1
MAKYPARLTAQAPRPVPLTVSGLHRSPHTRDQDAGMWTRAPSRRRAMCGAHTSHAHRQHATPQTRLKDSTPNTRPSPFLKCAGVATLPAARPPLLWLLLGLVPPQRWPTRSRARRLACRPQPCARRRWPAAPPRTARAPPPRPPSSARRSSAAAAAGRRMSRERRPRAAAAGTPSGRTLPPPGCCAWRATAADLSGRGQTGGRRRGQRRPIDADACGAASERRASERRGLEGWAWAARHGHAGAPRGERRAHR